MMLWYVMFFSFLIALFILSAYRIEAFINPNITEGNCYDYITNVLKYNIDHNIDKHLPRPPETPATISAERAKLLDSRKEVLQQFEAVKTKTYSGIGVDAPYAGSCILKNNRLLDYTKNTENCNFKGQILSHERDIVTGNYGRRKVINQNVQLTPFDLYVRQKGATQTDIPSLEKQYVPNDGCFIDVNNKDDFFDTITQFAKMQDFKDDNDKNIKDTDNARMKEKVNKLQNTLNLYGIPADQEFDTNIYNRCEDRQTNWEDNGAYQYNYLDRQRIDCGSEEMLGGFKLEHNHGTSAYKYKCCKPRTMDNRIKPAVSSNRMTTPVLTNWQEPWKVQERLQCEEGLNGIHLAATYSPNTARYNYRCSKMQKQMPKDTRNVQMSCTQKTTPYVEKNSGTFNMQYLNVDCQGDILRDVKMITNDNKYAYNYTCCRPFIN